MRNVTLATSRLPPNTDGVGDHAHRLASELHAAGNDVLTLADGTGAPPGAYPVVRVGRTWGFGATSVAVGSLARRRTGMLIVEYTPYNFGSRTVAPVALALAARILGMRCTLVAHELFHPPATRGRTAAFKSFLFGLRDRATVAMATDVVVTSRARLGALARRCPKAARRARIVPVGANVEPTEGFSRVAASSGAMRLVAFGVVMPRRRIELAIDALRELIDSGTDAHLSIVGRIADRNYERSLRDRAFRAGLLDRVTFTGAVDEKRLAAEFAAADAAIFSPVEGAIASSGALLALLAFGLPTIAATTSHDDSRFDGVLERVDPTPGGIAEAARMLGEDRAQREALGNRAAAFYAERFTWSSIAARISSGSSIADAEEGLTCTPSS